MLLQIFLSSREGKWFGLILPLLYFLYTLFSVCVLESFFQPPSIAECLGRALVPLITLNIPTLILIVIYFACRGGKKKKRELDKMNLQDLD